MNYYIQGDAANADKIRAAFEKLEYKNGCNYTFASRDCIYFTISKDNDLYALGIDFIELFRNNSDFQELELHVQPKFNFKVGDWTASIDDEGDVTVERIVNLCGNKVLLVDTDGCFAEYPKGELESCHIWTIADAKDGDVITNGKMIVIFNKLEEPTYKQHIIAYVGLDLCGRLQITEDIWQLGVDNAMPATKEQRDLLFKKMKEAGYQWDADKKELKKIKPHYDIANFKPFDKVLVRQDDSCTWGASFFGRYAGMFMCCNNACFIQCIPFNDDTKHLLGTTDMCDEQYINW